MHLKLIAFSSWFIARSDLQGECLIDTRSSTPEEKDEKKKINEQSINWIWSRISKNKDKKKQTLNNKDSNKQVNSSDFETCSHRYLLGGKKWGGETKQEIRDEIRRRNKMAKGSHVAEKYFWL